MKVFSQVSDYSGNSHLNYHFPIKHLPLKGKIYNHLKEVNLLKSILLFIFHGKNYYNTFSLIKKPGLKDKYYNK